MVSALKALTISRAKRGDASLDPMMGALRVVLRKSGLKECGSEPE